MAETISTLITTQNDNTRQMFRPLDSLQIGSVCNILVMVSRRWNNETPSNHYMSTEFLLSDQEGNVIQCTALPKYIPLRGLPLDEGNVYILKNILAIQNKHSYRVCKDNQHALLLLPQTTITNTDIPTEGFVRHPFKFIDFENIKPNDDKYLIDVVGHVHTVWDTRLDIATCEFLDCQLINGRGMVLDITLWGKFCREFLIAKHYAPANTPMIFAAMSVEHLDGHTYLSTTMDTTILNAHDIQGCTQLNDALAALKQRDDASFQE